MDQQNALFIADTLADLAYALLPITIAMVIAAFGGKRVNDPVDKEWMWRIK